MELLESVYAITNSWRNVLGWIKILTLTILENENPKINKTGFSVSL